MGLAGVWGSLGGFDQMFGTDASLHQPRTRSDSPSLLKGHAITNAARIGVHHGFLRREAGTIVYRYWYGTGAAFQTA
jgi:hypothetical protein